MYFRKSEVANDVLSNTRGGFCQSAMSNNFLIKGVGFEKGKSYQELSRLSTRKTMEKEKERNARPGKEPFNELAVYKPLRSLSWQVQTMIKTESQKEDNNVEKSTAGNEGKNKINANSYLSALISLKQSSSTGSTRRPQSGLGFLRKSTQPAKFCSLYEKREGKTQELAESDLCIKQTEALIQTRKHDTTKLRLHTSAAGETLSSANEDGAEIEQECKQSQSDRTGRNIQKLGRTRSAKFQEGKAVETYRKCFSLEGARKLKALNCALSRRSPAYVSQTVEDEDYQEIDFEYLLKLKAVSRLSRTCDASAIEAVAKENSVKTENILPPVHGSKWTLKDRYVAELSFNPPTPVLREYTRLSQARAVDFSDTTVGSQLYIL